MKNWQKHFYGVRCKKIVEKNGQKFWYFLADRKIFIFHFFSKNKKTSGGILVLNQSSEKLSDRTIGDEVMITRARARNCISSNSCLKFRFSLNLWRNALSKKRVIRKPSKIHNTYFFLHVVLLLYFKDALSTQKYCFAIFMYTLGVVPPFNTTDAPREEGYY